MSVDAVWWDQGAYVVFMCLASGGVGRLTRRLVGIGPVGGGGRLVLPCRFLKSYIAAGFYAILLR